MRIGRLCSIYLRAIDTETRIEGKKVFIEFYQRMLNSWYDEELLPKINMSFLDNSIEIGDYYLELFDSKGNDLIERFQINCIIYWNGHSFSID